MVHMVGHEGVTQQIQVSGFDSAPQQFEMKPAVFVGKENYLAVIPSLGHMVWVTRSQKPPAKPEACLVNRPSGRRFALKTAIPIRRGLFPEPPRDDCYFLL